MKGLVFDTENRMQFKDFSEPLLDNLQKEVGGCIEVVHAGCYRAAGSQRTRLRRWCGQHNSDENDHCAARNYPRQGCVCTGACIWQTCADL